MGSPFQIMGVTTIFVNNAGAFYTSSPSRVGIFTYKVAFRRHIAPNGAPAFGIVAVLLMVL